MCEWKFGKIEQYFKHLSLSQFYSVLALEILCCLRKRGKEEDRV